MTSNGANSDMEQDLVALNQQLALLEKEHNLYDMFFNRSTELLSIIGFDGAFKKISPSWCILLGYSEQELIGHQFADFVHPDDIATTKEVVVDLLAKRSELSEFKNRYVCKDGSYRDFLWNCASDPDTQSIFCFTKDITQAKQIEDERDLYLQAIERLPYGVSLYQQKDIEDNLTITLVGANNTAEVLFGTDRSLRSLIGKTLQEVYPGIEGSSMLSDFAGVIKTGKTYSFENAYKDEGMEGIYNIVVYALPNNHLGVMYEEITARKQAEEAVRQSIQQEEIIRAQKLSLDELSTPMIPISDSIMVMPLIGSMDSLRAQQVMDNILQGISDSRSQYLIIDITGVTIIDTQVANTFIRAAQAAKLLGAQVLLTGIRPEVAQTLVGLGVDLGSIITCSSLQRGITLVSSMEEKAKHS